MKPSEVKQKIRQRVPEFAKTIQPVYQVLNWRWHDEDTPPSRKQIEDALYELLDHWDGKSCYLASGGLWVYHEKPSAVNLCGEYGIRFEYSDTQYYEE